MSLQGIFDPVVRAYFENKNSGSGGGSYTGNACYVYDPTKEYESVVTDTMLGRIYKISDDIVTENDYADGTILFCGVPIEGVEGLEGVNCFGFPGGPVEFEGSIGSFANMLLFAPQVTDETKQYSITSPGIWVVPQSGNNNQVCFILNRK